MHVHSPTSGFGTVLRIKGVGLLGSLSSSYVLGIVLRIEGRYFGLTSALGFIGSLASISAFGIFFRI